MLPEKTKKPNTGYHMGFVVPLLDAATSNFQPSDVLTVGSLETQIPKNSSCSSFGASIQVFP